MHDLEDITNRVARLTGIVGEFILEERQGFSSSEVELKGHNDLVSYVDRNAEELIVKGLKSLLPEAGFITEENTSNRRGNKFNWIIDPLDGTTNFIHGVPCFCISIALLMENELIAGVVHELNLNECFFAWKGGGAFLNGRRINVSPTTLASNSLFATGFPYHDYSRMNEYMQVFDYCMRHTRGVRRLGSAAADLAYVACGRFDGFFEYGLNPWDVAAGALLVKEAGGVVTDFSGNNNYVFGSEIVATNRGIAKEFLTALQDRMKVS